MTFDDLVSEVMDRLNLTSEDARTRVGKRVNDRYKRTTSSIGLITSRRVTIDVTIDPTAIDSTLPDYTVVGIEKIIRITSNFPTEGIRTLKELTYDELTGVLTLAQTSRAWAVKLMGSGQVTFTIDSFTNDVFTLSVEGYVISDTLSDDAEPFMPGDFHDILVAGAMADELDKMEKPQLAQIQEQKYEARLSDLRMFIAKSEWLDIVQGKDKPDCFWYRNWFSRSGIFY